ncbi:hypothetical protein BDW68DRAFT_150077 [Aspergillus falconensis]
MSWSLEDDNTISSSFITQIAHDETVRTFLFPVGLLLASIFCLRDYLDAFFDYRSFSVFSG